MSTATLPRHATPLVAPTVPAVAKPSWIARFRPDLWLVIVVSVGAGIVHGINALGSPMPNDDEATYVSQAWALEHFGTLSHYTYSYDHPPLGWILLVPWNWALAHLAGVTDVWVSGRYAMVLVHMISAALVFGLVRRLGAARIAGVLAVAMFTLSPLGQEWQSLTLLDNIGTPFVLGACFLALDPKARLGRTVWAAALLAAAVLVKETNALFLPGVLGALWFGTRGRRRFVYVLFGTLFSGLVAFYPLYAIIKGELFEGPGHVSLLWSIKWQLLSRAGSGSALVVGSGSNMTVLDWLSKDAFLLIATVPALAITGWRVPRARPLAFATLVLFITPLRGGYLPAPFPINLIWPAAIITAVGLDAIVRGLVPRSRLTRAAAWILVTALLAAFPLQAASKADGGFWAGDKRSNYEAAGAWLKQNTRSSDVLLVDNILWIDMIQAGHTMDSTIWFYKLDDDPEIQHRYPDGWQDVDYVVLTPIMNHVGEEAPSSQAAVRNGTEVARYGDIVIYRVRH